MPQIVTPWTAHSGNFQSSDGHSQGGRSVTIQRSKSSLAKGTRESALYSNQTCFDADRSALVRELRVVGSAIEGGASEIEMIAAESVFDKQLSRI